MDEVHSVVTDNVWLKTKKKSLGNNTLFQILDCQDSEAWKKKTIFELNYFPHFEVLKYRHSGNVAATDTEKLGDENR